MIVVARGPITAALLAHLATGTGRPVGDAAVLDAPSLPYSVLYPLTDGTVYGSMGSPADEASYGYQVTSVGGTREQAEWIADLVRKTMFSGPISVPADPTDPFTDSYIVGVSPLGSAGGAERVGTVWQSAERFSVEASA